MRESEIGELPKFKVSPGYIVKAYLDPCVHESWFSLILWAGVEVMLCSVAWYWIMGTF